jgi:hypothetical protein
MVLDVARRGVSRRSGAAEESVTEKAWRLLGEGRLTVLVVAGDHVQAQCRDGRAVLDVGCTSARGWWCSCRERLEQCPHLVALRLVVTRRPANARVS